MLFSHTSETFLKNPFQIEIVQENDEQKMNKKVDEKEGKDFIYNFPFVNHITEAPLTLFSIIIIPGVTAPLIEHIVPPPNI